MLTSSPIDFNAVQTANITLSDMNASSNPISTPAKNYITCLKRDVERIHMVNTIVQHENEQLEAHVHERKHQLSGKRRVIDGKHLITAAELIGIQEAEKVTRARKEKQTNKAPRKRGPRVQKESSDESEVELELSEDDASDILDCIEVEL